MLFVFMLTPEIKAFLREHRGKSPEQLALLANKYPDLPMPFIAQQVKGREKIKAKLPSWYENPDTVFGSSLSLEQCSSERVAEFRASLVDSGKAAIDLTGGFGVDSRFLAEKFDRYRYVERDQELARIAATNFNLFGLEEKVTTLCGDGLEELERYDGELDFIYVDPARRDKRHLKVSVLEECEPDLIAVWSTLLERGSCVGVKASPGLDLSSVVAALPHIEAIYVISVESECKELSLIARRAFSREPRIHCMNILKSGEIDRFSFLLTEERELEVEFAPPGKFLYEPNASIMKAGGFKSVSKHWGIAALNPRTRLYGSDELKKDFQGRVFEVLDESAIGTKEAKRLFPNKRANVISRNSGMSAVELKQKLKLKDGGDRFAIGAAVSGVGRRLYCCRLVKLK